MPALRNLYGDDPDKMQEAVKRHLEFFNCATSVSPFIIGITCAMEEQYANSAEGGIRSRLHHFGEDRSDGSACRYRR